MILILSLKKDLEKLALELIKSGKVKTQAELWKVLGISSRKASDIVKKLEKEGLIRREKVKVGGTVTYKLIYVSKEVCNVRQEETKINDIEVLEIPCLTCLDIDRCGIGVHTPLTPETCEKLTHWLSSRAKQEEVIY